MKALVVVDYQVDFVNGALGFAGAEALDGIIVDKIRQTRRDNGAVIFTLDTHNSRYLKTAEGRKLPVPHCIAGTKGHELYGMVAHEARAGDIVIKKPSFGSMALAKELKRGYPDFYREVSEPVYACFDSLREDISWFCKKFDYRYDAEPWGNAKDAPDRAGKFLCGDLHKPIK